MLAGGGHSLPPSTLTHYERVDDLVTGVGAGDKDGTIIGLEDRDDEGSWLDRNVLNHIYIDVLRAHNGPGYFTDIQQMERQHRLEAAQTDAEKQALVEEFQAYDTDMARGRWAEVHDREQQLQGRLQEPLQPRHKAALKRSLSDTRQRLKALDFARPNEAEQSAPQGQRQGREAQYNQDLNRYNALRARQQELRTLIRGTHNKWKHRQELKQMGPELKYLQKKLGLWDAVMATPEQHSEVVSPQASRVQEELAQKEQAQAGRAQSYLPSRQTATALQSQPVLTTGPRPQPWPGQDAAGLGSAPWPHAGSYPSGSYPGSYPGSGPAFGPGSGQPMLPSSLAPRTSGNKSYSKRGESGFMSVVPKPATPTPATPKPVQAGPRPLKPLSEISTDPAQRSTADNDDLLQHKPWLSQGMGESRSMAEMAANLRQPITEPNKSIHSTDPGGTWLMPNDRKPDEPLEAWQDRMDKSRKAFVSQMYQDRKSYGFPV